MHFPLYDVLVNLQIIRGHSGFVYALEGIDDKTLISGAGDGCIKVRGGLFLADSAPKRDRERSF